MKNQFRIAGSVCMLAALMFAVPRGVYAESLDPASIVQGDSLYDKVGGRYPGELREESDPDAPQRTLEKSVRFSFLSPQDPSLGVRIGHGKFGLTLRGSLRRNVSEQDTGTYSLFQDDRDGDGIYETETIVTTEKGQGGEWLTHRQSLYADLSVAAETSSYALFGLLRSERSRVTPGGPLLAWPAAVTTAQDFWSSVSSQTDLSTGVLLSEGIAEEQAQLARDYDVWMTGLRFRWQGPVLLRMLVGYGMETESYFGSTTATTRVDTEASSASSSLSEALHARARSHVVSALLDGFVPAKYGVGMRFGILARKQQVPITSRRIGTRTDRMDGSTVGSINVKRDRIYEWVDAALEAERSVRWSGEVWLRTMPFGDRQVGEWLVGFRGTQTLADARVRETLNSTIRDLVDNGNAVADAGDTFKRGNGEIVFDRTTELRGWDTEIWTRVGGTFADDSLFFLRPAVGFHSLRETMGRSLVKQEPIVGAVESEAGTSDAFREPSAFQDLLIQDSQRLVWTTVTLDTVVDWRPVESLSILGTFRLNPLAGSGTASDPNVLGGWISRFGAEATYYFK